MAIRNEIKRERSIPIAKTALGLLSVVWEYADEFLDLDEGEIGDINPTIGVKRLYKVDRERKPWPPHVIKAFDAAAPPNLRLARLLAYYTGQRAGDLVKMQMPAFEGERIEVRATFIDVEQEKTSEFLSIPCHKVLREALTVEATRRREGAIITNEYGHAYASAKTLGQAFRRVLKKVDFKGYSIHGLRRNAAQALAEAGCSEREIMAITGHRTTAMVSLYTKGADQKRRARSAMAKWEDDEERDPSRARESANPENKRG